MLILSKTISKKSIILLTSKKGQFTSQKRQMWSAQVLPTKDFKEIMWMIATNLNFSWRISPIHFYLESFFSDYDGLYFQNILGGLLTLSIFKGG